MRLIIYTFVKFQKILLLSGYKYDKEYFVVNIKKKTILYYIWKNFAFFLFFFLFQYFHLDRTIFLRKQYSITFYIDRQYQVYSSEFAIVSAFYQVLILRPKMLCFKMRIACVIETKKYTRIICNAILNYATLNCYSYQWRDMNLFCKVNSVYCTNNLWIQVWAKIKFYIFC